MSQVFLEKILKIIARKNDEKFSNSLNQIEKKIIKKFSNLLYQIEKKIA